MSSKEVAVDGMTSVTTSTAKMPADTCQTGSWSNLTFVVIKGLKLSVDGKKVEKSSTATWSYIGGSSTNPAPPPPCLPLLSIPDSAALIPSTTKLKDVGGNLLRKGDKATGAVDTGNYIEVDAGQTKLKSA